MIDINPKIFRAYDIRGIVDKDFDEAWVERLGRACGTFFLSKGLRAAVLGHDCRHSSQAYQTAMAKGMAETGVDVVCLGMVPTPVFYYAVRKLNRPAGAVITASHNPSEYNGFKIWAGKLTLTAEEIQDVYRIMAKGDFAKPDKGHGIISTHDIIPSYIEDLASGITLESPLKVVLDGGNGAGGEICTELLKRVGAEVIPMYCVPDGNFPNHHPDPVVEKNTEDLKTRVLQEKAHLGIGLDGDADRLGVVDEQGRLMYGEELVGIYARDILTRNPGGLIIADVKCSHVLFKDIEAHGGKAQMGQTGHTIMKSNVMESGAMLAGEMSGHMFFGERFSGVDDALYASLRLLEILAKNPNKPLSTYLNDWPKTYSTPEIRMDCPDNIKFDIVATAQKYFRERYDVIDVDGVRVTFPDGWGLLRASNTQPVLVLRFEAESEERLEEIKELIQKPLMEWIETSMSKQ